MRRWSRACAAFLTITCLPVVAGCGEYAPDWKQRFADPEPVSGSDSALAFAQQPAEGRTIHLVRLVAHGDSYAFEPAEVRIEVGDVVRFVQTTHQPESVAFDIRQAPTGAASVLRRERAAQGPLLTQPGSVWDVNFQDAPSGAYPFASVSHAAAGMRGTVIVSETP